MLPRILVNKDFHIFSRLYDTFTEPAIVQVKLGPSQNSQHTISSYSRPYYNTYL